MNPYINTLFGLNTISCIYQHFYPQDVDKKEEDISFIASWSGGKDSCAALYRALSEGIEVSHLFNVVSEDGRHSMSHGLNPKLIAAQAEAIGIPIVQVKTSWDSYEADFKKVIRELKRIPSSGSLRPRRGRGSGQAVQAGIEGMIFILPAETRNLRFTFWKNMTLLTSLLEKSIHQKLVKYGGRSDIERENVKGVRRRNA